MTTDERIAQLEAQVACLRAGEHRSQLVRMPRYGRWLMFASILVCTGVLFGSIRGEAGARLDEPAEEPTDVIAAKALHVVDEEGRKRIVLDLSGDEARIQILDETGNVRAKLSASTLESGITLMDDQERQRASLGVAGEHGAAIALIDDTGRGGVMLHAFHNRPEMTLSGDNGQGRIMLSVTDGGPLVHLLDGDGERVWSAPEE